MKKIIATIIGLAILPSMAFASIDSNLKYGMSGQQVSELQEFLVTKGFLQVQPTGNFYSLTLGAVKAFQIANGIPNTGYVGMLTRAEINNELTADIASSTGAEIQETGTTTPIVVDQPSTTTFVQTIAPVQPVQTYSYVTPVINTQSLPIQNNIQPTMDTPTITYVQGINPDGTTYQTNIPLDTSTTTTYQTSSTDTITIAPDGTVISRTRNVRRSNVLGPLTPDEVAAMNN